MRTALSLKRTKLLRKILTASPESAKIQITANIYQIACISTVRFLRKIKSTGFRSKPEYPKKKKRRRCAFLVVLKIEIECAAALHAERGKMGTEQAYRYGELVFEVQKYFIAEEMESYVAEVIRKADIKTQYDTTCKLILSEVEILAWILKGCIPEYEEQSAREIAEKYICGRVQTGEVPVHPNERRSMRAGTSGVEDDTLYEGKVTYDVRCDAFLPEKERALGIIIDLEGQNKMNLKYPLLKREIYYGCRLISAQYGTEFMHSDYGKIKHVYSIWICMNPPKYRRNTINRYEITEKCEVGEVQESEKNYNLLTAITICLGDPEDKALAEQSEPGKKLLRLLDVLFFGKMSVKEKQKVLEEEYRIPMTEELKEEVEDMCNFSDGIEERGLERGRREGKKEGKREGRREGKKEGKQEMLIENLKSIIKNLGVSAEEAMMILGVPQKDNKKYLRLLSEN